MTDTAKPLTGRKVLMIAIGAFGTIIAANLALAYAAVDTFPGIEVKNGYIASQGFEAERAAQAALGWRAAATHESGTLDLTITDRTGATPLVRTLSATIGRPTTDALDRAVVLTPTADGWRTPADLGPGLWRIDIAAVGAGGERFRQRLIVDGAR